MRNAPKRKRCPGCGRFIEPRDDGTLKAHSSVWKNPPPGAPLCNGKPNGS